MHVHARLSVDKSGVSLNLFTLRTVAMKRMQDLPEEAFFSPEEAVALLDKGDRSILTLS